MLFENCSSPPTSEQLAEVRRKSDLRLNCLKPLQTSPVQDMLVELISEQLLNQENVEDGCEYCEITLTLPVSMQPPENQIGFCTMDGYPDIPVTYSDGTVITLKPMWIQIHQSELEYRLMIADGDSTSW